MVSMVRTLRKIDFLELDPNFYPYKSVEQLSNIQWISFFFCWENRPVGNFSEPDLSATGMLRAIQPDNLEENL